MIPCSSRCPNAPDPPVIYECTSCGEGIVVGDYVYKLDGYPYCESCVEDAREEVSFDDLD
jgi:formylmethanofuran dehydrogenase subunit E